MTEKEIAICEKAVKILRQPCDQNYRAIRLRYADQIELQVLVGAPDNDNSAVSLSSSIITASEAA